MAILKEQVGVPRLKEALAANDWAGDIDDAEVEAALEELDLDEDFPGTFASEDAEMNRELLNMKSALHNDGEAGPATNEADEASQVEELERMMVKMQAIKGEYTSLLVNKLTPVQRKAQRCQKLTERSLLPKL